jgi:prevent-host-death family protein
LAIRGLGDENCHAASLTNLTNTAAAAIFSRMPRVVNLYEAKTHLSALVDAAARGEEIVIAKNGVAKARLAPIPQPGRKRRPSGLMKVTYIADDFDEIDESVIQDFEGSD